MYYFVLSFVKPVSIDILSYTIGNFIFCIFKNFELSLIIITARVYKLRLAEVNFLSCLYYVLSFLAAQVELNHILCINIGCLPIIYDSLKSHISRKTQRTLKMFWLILTVREKNCFRLSLINPRRLQDALQLQLWTKQF